MNKILLKDINQALSGKQFFLLAGIGFDSRSVTLLENIDTSVPLGILGIVNPPSVLSECKKSFVKAAGDKVEILGENCQSVLEVIDEIQTRLQGAKPQPIELVIDITSLSHELLVAMIGLLASEDMLTKTTLLYTGASEYSYNTPNDQIWLSRGVTEVRSVLGFPGLMLPSKKLHLIVMAGFEVERASEVILRYEPSRLTIAYGERAGSISDQHHDSNKGFVEKIKEFLEEQDSITENLHHFEFSCVDPFSTAATLAKYVSQYQDENTVICPLNTKISTVGAAIAALKLPEIQICYAQVAEYNVSGYAKPGDTVTVVPLAGIDSLRIGE